ncbi:MAG: 2-C-methyl-D-erythritol 4-phosphate cytidylyltransferase [Acutalibacteraceae bacterium]
MGTVGKVYAVILAGGSGTRMHSAMPKQFLHLGGMPIFIHSVKTLLAQERVCQLWIGSNGDWLELAKEQVSEFCGDDPRIHLCEGGADREGTLLNTLTAICQNNTIEEDDIVLIHDAVRPFATQRIIRDVIHEMQFCDVCNTVIPVNDTIVQSADGQVISGMPRRSELFAGQSPQGFRIHALLHAFENLDAETRKQLTETTMVCYKSGMPIHIVRGEFFNFKITTPYDLEVASHILDFVEEQRRLD